MARGAKQRGRSRSCHSSRPPSSSCGECDSCEGREKKRHCLPCLDRAERGTRSSPARSTVILKPRRQRRERTRRTRDDGRRRLLVPRTMCCSMASSPTGTSPRRRGRESSSSADAGPPPPPPPFDLPAPRRTWEPLVEGPRGATTDPGLTLAATTTTSKNTWIAGGSRSPLVGDNPGYSSGGGREGGERRRIN